MVWEEMKFFYGTVEMEDESPLTDDGWKKLAGKFPLCDLCGIGSGSQEFQDEFIEFVKSLDASDFHADPENAKKIAETIIEAFDMDRRGISGVVVIDVKGGIATEKYSTEGIWVVIEDHDEEKR
jgi:hypothetical protein